MQLRYVFSELGTGLRRNLSMHLAVILTLFVSLTLVGLGVLLRLESGRAADHWGSQLQITVYLCKARDTNPSCTGEVTDAQKKAIEKVITNSPEVAGFHEESKQDAFAKLQETYPDKFDGPNSPVTAADMPQSIWITLKDPEQFQGVESAVKGLDGVSNLQDVRKLLSPIFKIIKYLTVGSWGTAVFLVVAALLLVANTIRLTAFARRREIGIMRLVGASSLYITLPFLLEALVTAALGFALAAGALAAFMEFAIYRGVRGEFNFVPWVEWPDFGVAAVSIAILGPALTLLPTLVLTRKYLKV